MRSRHSFILSCLLALAAGAGERPSGFDLKSTDPTRLLELLTHGNLPALDLPKLMLLHDSPRLVVNARQGRLKRLLASHV